MDELGQCKKIQCKGIKWDITVEGGDVVGGNYSAQPTGENIKLERYTLRCISDSGEDISITAPKPLDMMDDQELCDLIESQQSKP